MSTDHGAQAQEHYEEAVEANQNAKWETARFEMQLAKFHAEMALVEQQRIANMIAKQTEMVTGLTDGEVPGTDGVELYHKLDGLIRAGLGLA